MRIIDRVRLYRPSTDEYPVYMSTVKVRHPEVTFPNAVYESDIIPLGYHVVRSSSPPDFDGVVTEGKPVLVDGLYYQSWNTRAHTPEEHAVILNEKKRILSSSVNEQRGRELNDGMAYTFPDNDVLHVNLHPYDRITLLGLRSEAQSYFTDLEPDPPTPLIDFRTAENITKQLTPRQMHDLSDAALYHLKTLYSTSWYYKDLIDAATTVAELPVIPSPLTMP